MGKDERRKMFQVATSGVVSMMTMMAMMIMMTKMMMISDQKRRKMFWVATCGVWRSTTDGCSEEPR